MTYNEVFRLTKRLISDHAISHRMSEALYNIMVVKHVGLDACDWSTQPGYMLTDIDGVLSYL